MFEQSARALEWPLAWPFESIHCAMQRYAEWYGEWNDYFGSFRWQRLEGGDHSALGDCRATLELIRKMAGES
jgi:DNA polymerase-3 subunit epsilon